ncbi:DENN DOMAIN-CONTAINING PROTEIN 3 [Salix koriyanagi]|uniref:DENN DOMAIN-CONTAINING PROTEIN 3 n=1 Tax=Salix koriyanagi TaxID=2511006 RepID=A0A9Q0PNU0_9ROSI|nr:DENN DOMAIN-CONTAINING PROTEIN 3 [Salix koriyanagi]
MALPNQQTVAYPSFKLVIVGDGGTCVLPAGVEFYPSGFDSNDSSTFPKSYPIVFTGSRQVSLVMEGSLIRSAIVSNVAFPIPGKDLVLFAIEKCLLSVEAPPKDGLPHVEISFQPLVQCLDVDNLLKRFTAVFLERRILLRSNKYSLSTLASEAICHLIYPFTWQHVYIPLLFFIGVDYFDAPTPYMTGLH